MRWGLEERAIAFQRENGAHQTRLRGDAEVPTQEGSCLENWKRQRRAMLLKALEKKVGRAGGSSTSFCRQLGSGSGRRGTPTCLSQLMMPRVRCPQKGPPAPCPEAFPWLGGDMWRVLLLSTCLPAPSLPGHGLVRKAPRRPALPE